MALGAGDWAFLRLSSVAAGSVVFLYGFARAMNGWLAVASVASVASVTLSLKPSTLLIPELPRD